MGRCRFSAFADAGYNRVTIVSRRASSGLRSWLVQRLSAIYLLAFLLFFAYFLASNSPLSYHTWYDWVVKPYNRIIITVFFLALILHGWVGARDIIMDYVKPLFLRFTLLSIVMLLCIGFGFWALFVINRVT